MKLQADLEAYHDRELSWWRRRRVEAGLRRSPELRRELDLLKQMSTAGAIAERPLASPDLWADLSGQLGAVDTEKRALVGAGPAAGRPRLRDALSGPFGWKPVGLAMAAGAAVLAVGLWNPLAPLPEEPAVGVVRYLDTGGKSVMLIDEEDVTIIWLIEGGGIGDGA